MMPSELQHSWSFKTWSDLWYHLSLLIEGKCRLFCFWKNFCGFLLLLEDNGALYEPDRLIASLSDLTPFLHVLCARHMASTLLQPSRCLSSAWTLSLLLVSAQVLVECHLCAVPADHTKGSLLVTAQNFDPLATTLRHTLFIIWGVCFKLVNPLFYTPSKTMYVPQR